MSKDNLGDRMKRYEDVSRIYLTRRMPLILRLDGRAFHSFTKGFYRPYDLILSDVMAKTAETLCNEITGVKLAYTQSDEISLLITDYDTLDTDPWFGKNLQKMVSVAASAATLFFNREFRKIIESIHETFPSAVLEPYKDKIDTAMFDCRAFVLPKEEVNNYFVWRQQDASRNSIQMLARSFYSHKALLGKNTSELHELLYAKNVNWNNQPTRNKRGMCVKKVWKEDLERWKFEQDIEIPIFSEKPGYVNFWVELMI